MCRPGGPIRRGAPTGLIRPRESIHARIGTQERQTIAVGNQSTTRRTEREISGSGKRYAEGTPVQAAVEQPRWQFQPATYPAELGAPFSMVSVPRVNQVHLFFRAKVVDLEFKPGEETLEVMLFEEERIPWDEIAFRTVGYTLKRWFEDRKKGDFGFHAHDITS